MNSSETSREKNGDYSLETLSEAVRYHRFVYGLMRPYLGKKVLEFGAGIGNQTSLFLEETRNVHSIDIDENLLGKLRSLTLPHPRLVVQRISIQELAGRKDFQSSFDSVVSSNVLEHLSDANETTAAEAMFMLLKKGGYAVHWVPAFPALFGSLDESFAHYRRYTKETARALFRSTKFDIIGTSYWNMIGCLGWLFYGKVLRVRSIPRSSALGFDRYIMPLLQRIEPKIWRPFGQSLLIVARKPF